MPYITVTAAPSPQAVAKDPVTLLRFRPGYPTEVPAEQLDDIFGRLKSLEGLGFTFTADEIPSESAVPAPDSAPIPTAEQAVDPPAPPAPTP